MVTFKIPVFGIVVGTWRNVDPAKSFGFFRQFIVVWDQESVLTDQALKGYLYAYLGTDEALFKCWADYMKCRLAENEHRFKKYTETVN